MSTDSSGNVDNDRIDGWDRVDDRLRAPGSRLLHAIDRAASHPKVAVVVVTADAVWVLASLVLHFPTRLETVFQTLVAALTLAMVFVIQHTQSREQIATQRKLDEILRALPQADNALIALEDATDHQLARPATTTAASEHKPSTRSKPPWSTRAPRLSGSPRDIGMTEATSGGGSPGRLGSPLWTCPGSPGRWRSRWALSTGKGRLLPSRQRSDFGQAPQRRTKQVGSPFRYAPN